MAKHVYYMTQRPFSIGAQPKEGFVEAEDFDGKKYVEDIDRKAWSRIVYDRELLGTGLCALYDWDAGEWLVDENWLSPKQRRVLHEAVKRRVRRD